MHEATVPYVLAFAGLAIGCALLVYRSWTSDWVKTTKEFRVFQKKFMMAYLLMIMADWMQGPYVYELYHYYGFSTGAISQLFLVGFGSSGIFGTFVGSLADRYGRRANCVAYGVLYSLSCATKHFNNFGILMIGRFLGGVSTSILYSAFETWMIHEHRASGFPDEWMSQTFSHMTFGSGVVAILAGLISYPLALVSVVAPFDGSMALLIVGTVLITATWGENYGDTRSSGGAWHNLRSSFSMLLSNERILLLGIIQSCFESAMFVFVFMWTPSVQHNIESAPEGWEIPYGLIFACFMVCIMAGSNLFGTLVRTKSSEWLLRIVFAVAAMSLCVPVLLPSLSNNLFAFFVFEVCCGLYFPAIGTLRGKYVPEEVRATLMNVFRIGLNVIVVVVLLPVENLPEDLVFLICVLLLVTCCVSQFRLQTLSLVNAGRSGATGESDELLSTKADATD